MKKTVLYIALLCCNSVVVNTASKIAMASEQEPTATFDVLESAEIDSVNLEGAASIEVSNSETESVYSSSAEPGTTVQQSEINSGNIIPDPFNEAEMEAVWNSLFTADISLASDTGEETISLDASSEMEEISSIKDGEVIAVDCFSEIAQKNPSFFSNNGVSYITDSEQDEKLII